jgi:thiol:disulfide interchange protein DsbD
MNLFASIKLVYAFCLALIILAVSGVSHAEDFLDPEQAFQVKATMPQSGQIKVRFQVAPGYYLYRDKISFTATGAKLNEFQLPAGIIKYDTTFEKDVETFHDAVDVLIPFETENQSQNSSQNKSQSLNAIQLTVMYQGCADKGLCYPPQKSTFNFNAQGELIPVNAAPVGSKATTDSVTAPTTSPTNEAGRIQQALQSGKLWVIIPLFLLLGLGLAFTPCVLPMVPILSFIIVGEGVAVKKSRGFFLSLCYVLGMALVYTSLGVAAGLLGEGLSANLQSPWVLSAFALLMIVLSFSMFGIYQLQMPSFVQTKLTQLSENRSKGKAFGVFAMGAISALIVGPCVAAPLAGALVYISQTRDVLVGASALFAMAMGMGIPLLLVGISAGSLLPRAGAWMEQIKRFFGVLMLGMAWYMLKPLLPIALQMFGWGALGIGYALYLLLDKRSGHRIKAFAVLFALLGAMQWVGLSLGVRSVYAPLAPLFTKPTHAASFTRIKTNAELDQYLKNAQGKRVMLDFYADWCVSCIEMEKFTFTDPTVKAQMEQMILLQIDVTANNEDDKAVLKRFTLFGPPAILFFNSDGQELTEKRVIGFQNAEEFARSMPKD